MARNNYPESYVTFWEALPQTARRPSVNKKRAYEVWKRLPPEVIADVMDAVQKSPPESNPKKWLTAWLTSSHSDGPEQLLQTTPIDLQTDYPSSQNHTMQSNSASLVTSKTSGRGRPANAVPHIVMSISVRPEVKETLNKLKYRTGNTIGELVDQAVALLAKKLE